MRLLGFLGLDARGRGARLLDQLRRLGVGLRQHLLALRLDPGELGLDLLGVGQARRDLLAPRLEHLQDRLVGEPVQHAHTMLKLIVCAIRCGQSTPNVRAIVST